MPDTPYHVWKRSDGYIAATRGAHSPTGGGRDRDGTLTTFTTLLTTHDWAEARALIEDKRATDADYIAYEAMRKEDVIKITETDIDFWNL